MEQDIPHLSNLAATISTRAVLEAVLTERGGVLGGQATSGLDGECRKTAEAGTNNVETIVETYIILVEIVETVETIKKGFANDFSFLQFLQFLFEIQ